MRSVGIPKEVKVLEKRVGLTPPAVRELTQLSIPVYVEKGAGAGSGFTDQDYLDSGAVLSESAAEVYSKSRLIIKVKEPQPVEFPRLNSSHILFCYLHLASPENCDLVKALVESKSTAVAYETVQVGGKYPLLAPMSEIAGALASAYAAILQNKKLLGKPDAQIPALLHDLENAAGRYPGFNELPSLGRTVIFGGGVAGFKALETALKLNAKVVILETNPDRRNFLKQYTSDVYDPKDVPEELLEKADVLIGCVHSRGQRAVLVLSDKKLEEISCKRKKIMVDVSIDQGGNFPGSRATSYQAPAYFDRFQNLRFCVANMPSLCGRGASEALTRVTLPYAKALAEDSMKAFQAYPELKIAINVQSGVILDPAVKEAHQSQLS